MIVIFFDLSFLHTAWRFGFFSGVAWVLVFWFSLLNLYVDRDSIQLVIHFSARSRVQERSKSNALTFDNDAYCLCWSNQNADSRVFLGKKMSQAESSCTTSFHQRACFFPLRYFLEETGFWWKLTSDLLRLKWWVVNVILWYFVCFWSVRFESHLPQGVFSSAHIFAGFVCAVSSFTQLFTNFWNSETCEKLCETWHNTHKSHKNACKTKNSLTASFEEKRSLREMSVFREDDLCTFAVFV